MTRLLMTMATSMLLLLSVTGVQAQPPAAVPADVAQAFFDERDKNHDGKVSKEEWLTTAEARFKKMDANGDGFLSKDEMMNPVGSDKESGKAPESAAPAAR